MSVTHRDIIKRAVGVLQDTTSIRWPINELIRWFNDAQREVVMYRPDSMNTTKTMTLVAGSRQNLGSANLDPSPVKLIEITRNMGVDKSVVTQVPRAILDAQQRGWHNQTGVSVIKHYMFDARDPKTFYVYPPATTAATLEVMYAATPTALTELSESSSLAFSDVPDTAISLPEIYGNAVLDYLLYRAYSKDSEYAGNAARAQAHYAAFANALGVEIQSTVAVQPQLKPGMASAAA
jgi:hypothetical protein